MDGHGARIVSHAHIVHMHHAGTSVLIHPSSCLFGRDEEIGWLLFHEMVWTSKVFARTVCSVNYAWIKDLLPKLHEVSSQPGPVE